MANKRGWAEMVRVHNEVNMPTSNLNDMFGMDRAAMESKGAPARFLWILRETGTDLLAVFDATNGQYMKNLLRTYGNVRFFWFGGRDMVEVEVDTAINLAYLFPRNYPDMANVSEKTDEAYNRVLNAAPVVVR